MNGKACSFVFLGVIGIFLAACGSPAQPTIVVNPEPTLLPPTLPPILEPTSTPQPTRVPFDLEIQIHDGEKKPLPWAQLLLDNQQAILKPDENGMINIPALGNEKVKLSVTAPGYKSQIKDITLIPGENVIVFQLEDDLLGFKVINACGSEEKLLYIEDFQDQLANNWPEIDAGAMGWSIVEKTDEPGNFMIAASGNKEIQPPGTNLRSDLIFDNAVWRGKVLFSGGNNISTFLNWRHSFENGDIRYFTHIGPQVLVDLTRFNSGDGISVARSGTRIPLNKWAKFEMSTYNGNTQVWIDGKKNLDYTDKNPLAPGTIGLEPHFQGEGTIYFDDLAVCELNAPFLPLPSPTPQNK